MTGLARLQSDFQDYVQRAGDAIIPAIRDGQRTGRETLLGVYRDAYVLRLHECLSTDFKAVRAMVGEAAFFALAQDYVVRHPSTVANVRWFGHGFPAFAALRCGPAVGEMATFEWALGLATDAADDDAMVAEDLADLSGEEWAGLVLGKRAPVQRLTLNWQTPESWLRHEDCDPGTLEVAPCEAPVQWLVWRDGLDAAFRSLDEDEAFAFDAAMSGVPFAALCEGLCRFHAPDAAAGRAAGLLRLWIDHGLLLRTPDHA